MKCTWRQTFRRLAAGCVVYGSMAWSSAMCYAITLAHDNSSDPIYASGWLEGQNGGFGFTTGWDFDSGFFDTEYAIFYPYNNLDSHLMDDGQQSGTQFTSNPYNSIGSPAVNGNKRTWSIINDPAVWDNGVNSQQNPPPPGWTGETDEGVPRAGRGFSPLQVGQTVSAVIDTQSVNPSFNGGFWLRLNHNSQGIAARGQSGLHGNVCLYSRSCFYVPNPNNPGTDWAGSAPRTALSIHNWNYETTSNSYGRIHASGDTPPSDTGLFSYNVAGAVPENASNGMRVDVKMVTPHTYEVKMYLLGDSDPNVADATIAGTWENRFFNVQTGQPIAPVIDWIQFDHVTAHVNLPETPNEGRHFYIRSITIFDDTPEGIPGDLNEDGEVDMLDYVYWRKHELPPADYDLWRGNYGEPNGSGSGANSAVPEPGTFIYLVGMAGGLMGLAKRRRS